MGSERIRRWESGALAHAVTDPFGQGPLPWLRGERLERPFREIGQEPAEPVTRNIHRGLHDITSPCGMESLPLAAVQPRVRKVTRRFDARPLADSMRGFP